MTRTGSRVPPVRVSLPQAFLHAAAGAQLALLARHRTGRGQLVDVSAQASLGLATLAGVLAAAVGDPLEAVLGERPGPRRVDQTGSDPALKKWRCQDGLIEFHIGVGPATGRFTNHFLRWMTDAGAPVERFARLDFGSVATLIEAGTFTDQDMAELRTAVAGFLAARTRDEILAAAVEYKLLCVPVCDTADVVASGQLAARDFWATVESAAGVSASRAGSRT